MSPWQSMIDTLTGRGPLPPPPRQVKNKNAAALVAIAKRTATKRAQRNKAVLAALNRGKERCPDIARALGLADEVVRLTLLELEAAGLTMRRRHRNAYIWRIA